MWLLEHPQFGPALRNWRKSRAIPTGAKAMAVTAMAASYLIFLLTLTTALPLRIAVGAILLACAAFILTRPCPERAEGDVAAAES